MNKEIEKVNGLNWWQRHLSDDLLAYFFVDETTVHLDNSEKRDKLKRRGKYHQSKKEER